MDHHDISEASVYVTDLSPRKTTAVIGHQGATQAHSCFSVQGHTIRLQNRRKQNRKTKTMPRMIETLWIPSNFTPEHLLKSIAISDIMRSRKKVCGGDVKCVVPTILSRGHQNTSSIENANKKKFNDDTIT